MPQLEPIVTKVYNDRWDYYQPDKVVIACDWLSKQFQNEKFQQEFTPNQLLRFIEGYEFNS